MSYTYIINLLTQTLVGVVRSTDGANIPFDSENPDYRDYLDWVAQGNTASQPA